LRDVAGRDAFDESLDSHGAGRLAPEALLGVVETALAEALRVAAEAQHWEIVLQLAEELGARLRARRETEPDYSGRNLYSASRGRAGFR
jgi:hypothetical protein